LSELAFHSAFDGPVLGASARFAPGVAAVLGSDATALAHFVMLATGARAPRRGLVLFEGTPLSASPELRRATASLYAEEPLPPLSHVSEVVRAAYAARGDRRDPNTLLTASGLAAWSTRRTRDLDASERRTLALALALDHPSPRLLVLYEPLAAAGKLGAERVHAGIARAAGVGAIVISATQSLDDARMLGGIPWLLQGGVLMNVASAPLGDADGPRALVVQTPDARLLAAALARDPYVHGVRWDEASAPETVFVFGRETERLASAVTRVLSDESLRARSIGLSPIPLAELVANRGPTPPYASVPSYGAPYGTPYGAPGTAPSAAPGVGPYSAPGIGQEPYAAQAPQPAWPYVQGAPGPDATAPAPPDQSVSMPTSFADPARRPDGGNT
jgi:ABC-type thiamine transport system ATPase subunit